MQTSSGSRPSLRCCSATIPFGCAWGLRQLLGSFYLLRQASLWALILAQCGAKAGLGLSILCSGVALNLTEADEYLAHYPGSTIKSKVMPFFPVSCVHQAMLLDWHIVATWIPPTNPLNLGTGERRSRRDRLAELLDFATEHFLNDAELAQQHAQNLLIEGLYSEQYWVSSEPHRLHSS